MEWRCEWCGKPHEENDPPCDNCGHGKFEEAVVRQTDLGDGDSDPTLVWVCIECGREHPKNSPPCSRCGAHSLEKRRQEIDEADLTAPGYLDLVTPQYLAAVAVALVLATVFVLGVTGIVDVPGFGGPAVPDVENVPGNATHTGEIPFTAVEEELTATVNDRRDGDQVGRDGDLDAVARYLNQQAVRSGYVSGADDPTIDSSVQEVLSDSCSTRPLLGGPVQYDGGGSTAAETADGLVAAYTDRIGSVDTVGDSVGVDVHEAPDGSLWLYLVSC